MHSDTHCQNYSSDWKQDLDVRPGAFIDIGMALTEGVTMGDVYNIHVQQYSSGSSGDSHSW